MKKWSVPEIEAIGIDMTENGELYDPQEIARLHSNLYYGTSPNGKSADELTNAKS